MSQGGVDVKAAVQEWNTLSVFKRGSWREASRSPPQGFLQVSETVEDSVRLVGPNSVEEETANGPSDSGLKVSVDEQRVTQPS